MMIELIKAIFPPVRRYSQRLPWEWQLWNEPFAELHPADHGVVRQLSSEAISRNGLDLTFEDHGFSSWRVN